MSADLAEDTPARTPGVLGAAVRFDAPGWNSTLALPIQKSASLFAAQLSSSGAPLPGVGVNPSDPALRLDPTTEPVWRFSGKGYGSLGEQQLFATGSPNATLQLPAGGSSNVTFLMPQASVDSAEVEVAGDNPSGAPVSHRILLGNSLLLEARAANLTLPLDRFPGVNQTPVTSLAVGQIVPGGAPEIAIGDGHGYVTIAEMDPGGARVAQKLSTRIRGHVNDVVLIDADQPPDGLPELIALEREGALHCWKNSGGQLGFSGEFQWSSGPVTVLGSLSLADGRSALVAGSVLGELSLFPSPAACAGAPSSTLTGLPAVTAIGSGDLDSDGRQELVVGFSTGELRLISESNGSLQLGPKIGAVAGSATSIALGLVRGLSLPEVLVGDATGRLALLGRSPNGSYSELWSASPWSTMVVGVASADFDGDGRADVGGIDQAGVAYAWRGDPSGSLGPMITIGNAAYASSDMVAADFDVDGDPDFIAGCACQESALVVARGVRNGYRSVIELAAPLKQYLATAEFNEDPDGNRMASVPLTVYSTSPVKFEFGALHVTYDPAYGVDLVRVVAEYVAVRPANETGFVNVPLNFSSGSPGVLEVEVRWSYSRAPPFLLRQLPSPIRMAEDAAAVKLADLEEFFSDDVDDGRLSFSAVGPSDPAHLRVAIEEGRFLSLYPALHWWGNATFRVSATDSTGESTESGVISVEVFHVNHAPAFSALPASLKTVAGGVVEFPLHLFVDDVEDGTSLRASVSDALNVTVILSPLRLRLAYPTSGVPAQLRIDLLDREGGTASATVPVIVKEPGSPVFLGIVPLRTPRGLNRTSADPVADLSSPSIVFDNDTPQSALRFAILSQSPPPGVKFSLAPAPDGPLLTVAISDPEARGSTALHLRVTDGTHSDEDNITVVFDEKLAYIGGLASATVPEDTTWSVDLGRHFNIRASIFSSNRPDDVAISGANASWTPFAGAVSVTGLVFTAVDPLDPNNRAQSPPIDLTFVEVNDAPRYIGGLRRTVVPDTTSWQAKLESLFLDEESPPSALSFAKENGSEVVIDQTARTINWTPGPTSANQTGIVIIATDDGSPPRSTRSPPFDLIRLPRNFPPRAVIDSAAPSPAYRDTLVDLRGHGEDPDGTVVAYVWNSSLEGALGNVSELHRRLAPGLHAISLQVRDDRGNWSSPAYVNLTVIDQNAPLDRPTWPLASILAGVLMAVAGAWISRRVRSASSVVKRDGRPAATTGRPVRLSK